MLTAHKRTRLTQPLIRTNGRFYETSWDHALKRAAEIFTRIQSERGSDGIGVFSCSKSTNELNYLASKFARVVLETHHVDSCNRT